MLKSHKFSALITAVLLLSGCSIADAQPDTATMKPFGNGVDTAISDLQVQDTTLVTHADGTAVLTVTVINNGETDDVLTAVTINGKAAMLSSENSIPANGGTLRIGFTATAFAELPAANLAAGTTAQVNYSFKRSGEVAVTALVVDPIGEYALVTPQPVASILPVL